MTTKILDKSTPQPEHEQRFVRHGLTWQQFKAIQASFEDVPGVRLSYLDGTLELMTIREPHEVVSTILGVLLALYFAEIGINVYGTGSVTLEAEERGASVEPDLSYYVGGTEGKDYPDLAIEVVYTSGNIKKLEKYKRFGVTEVWFWEDEQLFLYRLHEHEYEQIPQSDFFPDLNLALLVRCTLIHLREKNMTQAMTKFINEIRVNN
ncbi:Uma2 family endonuclease [Funiculus sociatus]|uniref:Uma2 family endonuclease n=1 Tax=Funiculus sociatus TaxID=450527 RepID=UPI0032980EC4